MRKVAFLDRDGVINKDLSYVYKREDFHFVDGCIEALSALQKKGFTLIVVTNQSGIGRGYYNEQDYQQLTQWYVELLAENGVAIEKVYHCPHTPEDACSCRKPSPGMLLMAANDYDIDFSSSLMVGDKLSDLRAAKAASIDQLYFLDKHLIADTFIDEGELSYRSCKSLSDCIRYII